MPTPVCLKHGMEPRTQEWEEGMTIIAHNVNPKGMSSLEPCPGCLDQLIQDLYEAHSTLDSLQIPRRAFGKNDLTITQRLALVFEKMDNGDVSDMRTS